jgi:hypothetical protein
VLTGPLDSNVGGCYSIAQAVETVVASVKLSSIDLTVERAFVRSK